MKPIYALCDLIKSNQKQNITVAEIGVWDGTTTKEYLNTIEFNNGKLYAIDWFCGNENVSGPHAYNKIGADNIYNQFITNISKYIDIVEIKRGLSHDMIPLIPDKSLDICFIDADHRYSNVYKDIELCLPKMKENGILCGHDLENINVANSRDALAYKEHDLVNGIHYGVIQAVYDHFGSDIKSIPDPNGQNIPIWIKYL